MGAAIRYPGGHAKSSASEVDRASSTNGDPVEWTAVPGVYSGATICVDVNDNGFCDSGEDSTISSANGSFSLLTAQTGPLTATIDRPARFVGLNGGAATVVSRKMIFRVAPQQVKAAPGQVIVNALSTEVLRILKADVLDYDSARQAIAARLSFLSAPRAATDVAVSTDELLSDLSNLSDAKAQSALLFEEQVLQNRSALVAAILDRGYVHVLAQDSVKTIQEAQTAAFAIEDIPRYDHLFVIIFENHPNTIIDNPAFPDFYKYLNTEGNKASSYFSVGNPSEPNYVTLASGDDWGITDDDGWNCVPSADTGDKPTDVYNPRGDCGTTAVHNLVGRRNLFTALYRAGLSARVYSESMDPGQDPRVDGRGNPAIMGVNRVSGQAEPFISDLYKTKHHPAMNFDEVRTRPDFFRNLTRTVGGGQWDDGIAAWAKTHSINNWNTHQFEDDLQSGDVGALNYIVPDQCDDIHTTGTQVADCSAAAYPTLGILRGNAYAKYLVDKIEASPLWKNTARRVGIVLVFDEGSFFTGSSSCCGWNVGGGDTAGGPLDEGITKPYPTYASGNKGDGPTIFGVLNNQPKAPKGIRDSDSYSHISFVRTLQDMFGLADPADDSSYMNRSKYTERYIAAHLKQLPEYQKSADTHFDAVRPMNHAYVVTTKDRQSGGLLPEGDDMLCANLAGSPTSVDGKQCRGVTSLTDFHALGPDPNQINIWAVK